MPDQSQNSELGTPLCPDHKVPMTKKGIVVLTKKPLRKAQRYECPIDNRTYTSPIWQSGPKQVTVTVRKKRRARKDIFDLT